MVTELLREGDVDEERDKRDSVLDLLFGELERKDPYHIAVKYYNEYRSGAAKTLKSIQITLAARLEKFNLESLAAMTVTDELELDMLGKEKTALFALIPDNDTSFNFLVSILYCKEDVIALIHSNLQYALTGNNSILDTVAIEKQIDNYYDQMGTLVERSASTSGDTDLYDREIKKLCDKIEALRETLKTEQSKSVMTEDVKASIDRILGYLSKTDERSFLTYDDVTIRRLVECIVVHPEGKISVTLKGGFRGEETI